MLKAMVFGSALLIIKYGRQFAALVISVAVLSVCMLFATSSARADQLLKGGQFSEWKSDLYYVSSSKQEVAAYKKILSVEYKEILQHPEKYSVKYRIAVLGRYAERIRENRINGSLIDAEHEVDLERQIQKLLVEVKPPPESDHYRFYYVQALQNLARLLITDKEYARAEKLLQEALIVDDPSKHQILNAWTDWSTIGKMAWVNHKFGDDDAANRYFDVIFKGHPINMINHDTLINYIDFLRDSHRDSELRQYLQLSRDLRAKINYVFTAYDLSQAHSSHHYLAEAEACRECARVEMARKLATLAVDSAKTDPERSRAQSFLKCSLPATAIPKEVEHKYWLAIQARRDHDWEDARENCLSCASLEPNFEWAYRQISDVDLEQHDYNEAEEYALKSVAVNPDYAKGWAQLALVRKLRNDSTGSAAALTKAVALDADDMSELQK